MYQEPETETGQTDHSQVQPKKEPTTSGLVSSLVVLQKVIPEIVSNLGPISLESKSSKDEKRALEIENFMSNTSVHEDPSITCQVFDDINSDYSEEMKKEEPSSSLIEEVSTIVNGVAEIKSMLVHLNAVLKENQNLVNEIAEIKSMLINLSKVLEKNQDHSPIPTPPPNYVPPPPTLTAHPPVDHEATNNNKKKMSSKVPTQVSPIPTGNFNAELKAKIAEMQEAKKEKAKDDDSGPTVNDLSGSEKKKNELDTNHPTAQNEPSSSINEANSSKSMLLHLHPVLEKNQDHSPIPTPPPNYVPTPPPTLTAHPPVDHEAANNNKKKMSSKVPTQVSPIRTGGFRAELKAKIAEMQEAKKEKAKDDDSGPTVLSKLPAEVNSFDATGELQENFAKIKKDKDDNSSVKVSDLLPSGGTRYKKKQIEELQEYKEEKEKAKDDDSGPTVNDLSGSEKKKNELDTNDPTAQNEPSSSINEANSSRTIKVEIDSIDFQAILSKK